VSKDGDQAGPSGINNDDEVVEPAATDYVGPNTDVGGERITSMKSFERLMINRMDSLAEQQNNLYEMRQSRFQQFDQNFQGLDARLEIWMSILRSYKTRFQIYSLPGTIVLVFKSTSFLS